MLWKYQIVSNEIYEFLKINKYFRNFINCRKKRKGFSEIFTISCFLWSEAPAQSKLDSLAKFMKTSNSLLRFLKEEIMSRKLSLTINTWYILKSNN